MDAVLRALIAGLSLATLWYVALCTRALGTRAARAELRAALPHVREFVPVLFPPANADSVGTAPRFQDEGLLAHAIPGRMRDRIALILRGRWAEAGAEEALTTAIDRDALLAPFLDRATPEAIADALGLTIAPCDALPASDPQLR